MWAGTIGAWLLFAGPLFQGSLELWEVARTGPAWPDRKRIDKALWLVPPVMYFVQRARFRRSGTAAADVTSSFSNRASGWFAVAIGGLLVAVKETWELAERYELSPVAYWSIVVVVLLVSQLNVTVRMLRLSREPAAGGSS
ncbi:hypothetical protein SAMN06295943_3252 [Agreia sp. VKM Ac-1783]|nr:hypothetical protein SAMN06295943_3252 [Agreia sp. VKM Ac-1783]